MDACLILVAVNAHRYESRRSLELNKKEKEIEGSGTSSAGLIDFGLVRAGFIIMII